jgi:hypothetical protein
MQAGSAGPRTSATKSDGVALTVSAATPCNLLQNYLIAYDRQRDLAPLLFEFSTQTLGFGEGGGSVEFDLDALQAAICERILKGRRLLALQVPNFCYSGETRARGGLSALQAVVPQAPAVPPSVSEALCKELDTREQVVLLLGLLEEAIHCLVAVGSRPAGLEDGATVPHLVSYLRDVALVDERRLTAGLPSSVAQQCTVCHLRALFLVAEDCLLGGGNGVSDVLLPAVPLRYRVPLPKELRAELLKACMRCGEMESVVPTLRDLLTGALSDEAAGHPGNESLKLFLVYEDIDLESQPWFSAHFPAALRLEHALEAFRAMVSALAAPGGSLQRAA